MPSNVSQILYGDLNASSLNLTGSDGISIRALATASASTVALVKQYASSSSGLPGFGIKNEFYGSIGNFYPFALGSVSHEVENQTYYTTKKTDYIGYNSLFEKINEYKRDSFKEFSAMNSNFTHRKYILYGTTNGTENVYLAVPTLPRDEYIEMPDQESWNYELRIIARRTDGLASDAFFIYGYCDNYGTGSINGQAIQPLAEIGSNVQTVQGLAVVVVLDQDGGTHNYFRVQAQSTLGTGTVQWIGYLDVVANYASASARPGGPGAT